MDEHETQLQALLNQLDNIEPHTSHWLEYYGDGSGAIMADSGIDDDKEIADIDGSLSGAVAALQTLIANKKAMITKSPGPVIHAAQDALFDIGRNLRITLASRTALKAVLVLAVQQAAELAELKSVSEFPQWWEHDGDDGFSHYYCFYSEIYAAQTYYKNGRPFSISLWYLRDMTVPRITGFHRLSGEPIAVRRFRNN